MTEVDEYYRVKYGNKTREFSTRELAKEWAQEQAVLPFVQRLRNGNGSMDHLCRILIDSRDEIDIALASVDEHIKQYVEVK